MPDDEEDRPPEQSSHTVGLIGAFALVAWFGMLWLMFGDVL